MIQIPNLIEGGSHTDQRGTICFINDFDMTEIKRSYVISHPDANIVRGWRAHKVEQRWFFVLEGEFAIRLVKIDNWETPDKKLPSDDFVLTASKIQVLHIPAGYASLIQAIRPDSKLIVYADYGIENAHLDDYLYPSDYFELKN